MYLSIVNGRQQGFRSSVVGPVSQMRFVKIYFSPFFFKVLNNIVCAAFQPLYQEICLACTRINIAIFIQPYHSFERCFQFRLLNIYLYDS